MFSQTDPFASFWYWTSLCLCCCCHDTCNVKCYCPALGPCLSKLLVSCSHHAAWESLLLVLIPSKSLATKCLGSNTVLSSCRFSQTKETNRLLFVYPVSYSLHLTIPLWTHLSLFHVVWWGSFSQCFAHMWPTAASMTEARISLVSRKFAPWMEGHVVEGKLFF